MDKKPNLIKKEDKEDVYQGIESMTKDDIKEKIKLGNTLSLFNIIL